MDCYYNLDQKDPEPMSSLVPLPVSSAVNYLGGPSMLSYYTPTSQKLGSTAEKVSTYVANKPQNALASNTLSQIITKSGTKLPKPGAS